MLGSPNLLACLWPCAMSQTPTAPLIPCLALCRVGDLSCCVQLQDLGLILDPPCTGCASLPCHMQGGWRSRLSCAAPRVSVPIGPSVHQLRTAYPASCRDWRNFDLFKSLNFALEVWLKEQIPLGNKFPCKASRLSNLLRLLKKSRKFPTNPLPTH